MAVSIKEALGSLAITSAELAAAGSALEATEEIAKWALADDNRDTYEAHHTIAVVVSMLRDMFEGKISATDTVEEIKALKSALMVDSRFDRSEL